MKKVHHIHIGTGKFGLGFVGHFSHQLGFKLSFLNRKPRAEDSITRNGKLFDKKKYEIRYFDKNESETIQFENLRYFDNTLNVELDLNKDIANEDTLLITTAVGESQLPYVGLFLASGLQKRAKTDFPVFILACENGHRCSTQLRVEVKKHLPSVEEKNVVFADCVVDRICQDVDLSKDYVTVSSEAYKEWIIADVDKRLNELLNHVDVKLVPQSHLELYECRKLWLLNGFHLAVAILGVSSVGQLEIKVRDIFERGNEKLTRHLSEVADELVNAMYFRADGAFPRSVLKQYVQKVRERIISSPDDTQRLLKDLLLDEEKIKNVTREFGEDLGKDNRLSDVFSDQLYKVAYVFFKKVKERIYDPAITLISNNSNPTRLSYVMVELMRLVAGQGERLRS